MGHMCPNFPRAAFISTSVSKYMYICVPINRTSLTFSLEKVKAWLATLMESALFEDELVVTASIDSLLAVVPLLQKIEQLNSVMPAFLVQLLVVISHFVRVLTLAHKDLISTVVLSLTETVNKLLGSYVHGKRVLGLSSPSVIILLSFCFCRNYDSKASGSDTGLDINCT